MSNSTKNRTKECPESVLELTRRFELHRDTYRKPTYNETQVRREFIDPLFKALGWDVDNKQGYAEAYKEVIHEDAVKVGSSTKAPDYCFRIGSVRKFFVEAKKPAEDIKQKREHAYQLRRYAWTAKLPVSILTDFEEFAVFDCTKRPKPTEQASTGRILYVTYDEYASRWNEIASVFSKGAIPTGAFDKFAESTKRKRGTSEVDDEFLKEIEQWRDWLARNIALRDPGLSVRELNFAVAKTIDRIIFLRMCEDRGVETYAQLGTLPNGPRIYPRLVELFRRADERYNSGLFHFEHEKGRPEEPDTLTPKLSVDDKVLRDIIKRLYYPECPYEFSVMPSEILGQVYEQFLGKVITLTAGHRAKIEYKPEVKKAGGVYYTPKYIVDYIVEHTVGRLLEDKTPADVGPMLDQRTTTRTRKAKSTRKRPPKRLTVLDPACGSGSFLLGAYQYLLDWHLHWYTENDPETWAKKKNAPIYKSPKPDPTAKGPTWRLTVAERKRILLNNIFGVDIDPQAVEVTKLSLLLKVLEGESHQTLDNQLRLFHERALPDLASNIKCGNSLIGPDFYEGKQLDLLDEEERYRINAFDWQAEFPDIMNPPRPGVHRDEGAPIPNRDRKGAATTGGFDAVIGNPPYGALFGEQEKTYLGSNFVAQTYQLDSYQLFLERGVTDLLAEGGFYGMIIPNPWLTNLVQTAIRRLVTTKTRIVDVVHFRFAVFPKVTVDTQIVVLQKADPVHWRASVSILRSWMGLTNPDSHDTPVRIEHDQDEWREANGAVINIFLSAAEKTLAQKCCARSQPLRALCKINVGIKPYQVGKGRPPQTRRTVQERCYDSERPLGKEFRAYLRGCDIGRYRIRPLEARYIKYGSWLAEPRPAADFDSPVKLVMRQTGDGLIATMDKDQYLCLNNMHVIVPQQNFPTPYFLLAVINSRLLNWYYRTLNPEVGEALAEVKKTNVAELPIREIDLSERKSRTCHDTLTSLVDRMLGLHNQLDAAKTPTDKTAIQRQIDATDRQIDRLVYQLYDLSDEEIGIVEEATQR
ncbi:MAG: N-6 DNA methylase [Phycisphaerales bacterium]|nr:MAG: N-6 DNA methylase [Phycisphaerales bacterium]